MALSLLPKGHGSDDKLHRALSPSCASLDGPQSGNDLHIRTSLSMLSTGKPENRSHGCCAWRRRGGAPGDDGLAASPHSVQVEQMDFLDGYGHDNTWLTRGSSGELLNQFRHDAQRNDAAMGETDFISGCSAEMQESVIGLFSECRDWGEPFVPCANCRIAFLHPRPCSWPWTNAAEMFSTCRQPAAPFPDSVQK